tara:strand:+ start:14121 stop:16391 length:2271 start_codon:yes stop_codon:yes gene_type:complete
VPTELAVVTKQYHKMAFIKNKQDKEKLKTLMEVYKKNLEKELGSKVETKKTDVSLEYLQFKKEFTPAHFSFYEKLCTSSEKILKIKPDKKREKELEDAINIAHLNVTPSGVLSFAYFIPALIFFVGSILSILLFDLPVVLAGEGEFKSLFFVFFFLFLAAVLIKPFSRMAEFIANGWRLKSSNQMVLCIFYVVTYMRHTPNLENALKFASQHLTPPLSLDLKKVIWDIETEKYSSIQESLDNYLDTWKKWNLEFIEAFHLIEASLYEGEESRRLNTLDKSLDVILNETYEKMLHYAHNLQSPITMLHMLGIILPILGLVILPLVVSFMDNVNWLAIAAIYNLLIPVSVFYIGKTILSRRPTGYGDSDISEYNPELKKLKNINIKIGSSEIKIKPIYIALSLGFFVFFLGMIPLILHSMDFPDFGFGLAEETSVCGKKFCFFEYRQVEDGEIGPFGLGASLFSLFIPLSIGLAAGVYFKMRSKNVIKIRNRAKKLEDEFASSLYQLGNRLGDNLPVEVAVGKVSSTMEGTVSGNFFKLVSYNIRRLGMSIDRAIFDPKMGALAKFPSNIIESSMKVLTQSIKKGPLIAAQALTNVSRYIKEIHRVNERLKDLMADIISSMNSQIKFLTPAIAAVVIGITSMTTAILGKLGNQFTALTQQGDTPSAGRGLFGGGDGAIFGNGVPTFYFQIVVGIYVVQITYILTIMANGILNGSDKLSERYELGKNLTRSTILYCTIAGMVMLGFNLIAGNILDLTFG